MSLMKGHFKPYCWILVVSGLMLFHKLQATDEDKRNGVRKVCYLFYSLTCFILFALIQAFYFHHVALMFLTDVQVFTKWLYITVFTIVSFKVALNILCMARKSRYLFDFFKESARYENSVNFVPPDRYRQTPSCYARRLLQCLAFVGNVAICSYLVCDFIDNLQYRGAPGVILKVACVAGNAIFYVYQMVDFIVLRPCLEVLLLYIGQQHQALRCLVDGGDGALFVNRAMKVQEIRMAICVVALLKRQLNSIWHWCIMVSGAVVLLLTCVCVYTAFVEGFSTLQTLLGILYCVLSILDILDIAGLSQEMVNEMRSVRQSLQGAQMCFQNGDYFNQVCYLRDSIKPKEMAISGAGFFSLNLPLIVSLAGSVITYTVILVQTSESVNSTSTTK